VRATNSRRTGTVLVAIVATTTAGAGGALAWALAVPPVSSVLQEKREHERSHPAQGSRPGIVFLMGIFGAPS